MIARKLLDLPTTLRVANRIGLIFVTLVLLTSETPAALLSESFDLQCAAKGPKGVSNYTLHVDVPKFVGSPRIKWVGTNTHDLRVVVFDETMIIADVDGALSGFPDQANAMSFRINRITGTVEVNYLSDVKTDTTPPPGFKLLLDQFSETGRCTKLERAF